eukprot:1459445-Amphidinium_carterae.3
MQVWLIIPRLGIEACAPNVSKNVVLRTPDQCGIPRPVTQRQSSASQCCEQSKIQTVVRMDQSVQSVLLTVGLGVIPFSAVIDCIGSQPEGDSE